jgi:hypothetical protein
LDTTSAFTGGNFSWTLNTATAQTFSQSISELFGPQLGRHTIAALKNDLAALLSTLDLNSNNALQVKFRM